MILGRTVLGRTVRQRRNRAHASLSGQPAELTWAKVDGHHARVAQHPGKFMKHFVREEKVSGKGVSAEKVSVSLTNRYLTPFPLPRTPNAQRLSKSIFGIPPSDATWTKNQYNFPSFPVPPKLHRYVFLATTYRLS